MENIETLTADDIISAYKNAGYEMTEKYSSVTLKQLKFRRNDVYVDFNWNADEDYPLKFGTIDIFIANNCIFYSKARYPGAEKYTFSKELLYKASINIDTKEKLLMYLHNAMTEKLLETL